MPARMSLNMILHMHVPCMKALRTSQQSSIKAAYYRGRTKGMQPPVAVSAGPELAHGALDSEQLAAQFVPGSVHLAVWSAANHSLKVKVVLKGEEVWLHHTGCPAHESSCSRHQNLHGAAYVQIALPMCKAIPCLANVAADTQKVSDQKVIC